VALERRHRLARIQLPFRRLGPTRASREKQDD
jgi:hypothetical protein